MTSATTGKSTGVLEQNVLSDMKESIGISLQAADSATSMTHDDEKHEVSGEMDDNVALSKTVSGPPYTIFDLKARIFIVLMVAVSALISPFAATLYYPALNPLAEQLHVSSSLINLSITTYMICQAIAPAIVASISDSGGRRLSFIICFAIFTIANIGLALQTNYAALLVLRMIQAAGSSGTIALSMAVIADISTSAQRGKYNGFATAGILFGPAAGPSIGGVLSQYLGWRSVFWFLAIFSGTFLFLFAIVFPETCRQVVGNGSIPARGINRSVMGHFQQKKAGRYVHPVQETCPRSKRKSKCPNPFETLKILGDKESALLLVYNALTFSGQMIITASLPSMLKKTYGYNEFKVGLCFLPAGVGALCASIGTGYLMDWNFRRHARKVGMEISKSKQQDLGGFPLEKARVEVIWPFHILTIAAIIGFGWVVYSEIHIAAVEVLLFFVGFVITAAFNISNAFIIDLHRDSPATATAAVNLTRCLISAGGVAAVIPLIDAIGRGWTFTLIGLIDLALTPCLLALTKWGPKWREQRFFKQQNGKEREDIRKAANNISKSSTTSTRSNPPQR